jgi:hypothetical protein
MLPAILKDLEKVERTINGWAYQLDHRDVIAEIILRITRYGVQCRLILDKENFYGSSCARQAAGVNELFRAGCLIRIRKPPGGLYSCVHVKCLIFDEKVMMSGSLNLTHNGLQNNKEHLYRLSEPELIEDVMADFDREWMLAEGVGEREISIMLAKDMSRKEERQTSVARTIPIRQSTAETIQAPGDWRSQLDLEMKDGCPVALDSADARTSRSSTASPRAVSLGSLAFQELPSLCQLSDPVASLAVSLGSLGLTSKRRKQASREHQRALQYGQEHQCPPQYGVIVVH